MICILSSREALETNGDAVPKFSKLARFQNEAMLRGLEISHYKLFHFLNELLLCSTTLLVKEDYVNICILFFFTIERLHTVENKFRQDI